MRTVFWVAPKKLTQAGDEPVPGTRKKPVVNKMDASHYHVQVVYKGEWQGDYKNGERAGVHGV